MPCGVFHDLKDMIPDGIERTIDYCCSGNYNVIDRVQGYNSQQIFNLFDNQLKSPASFYGKFKQKFGQNNNLLLQNMDLLFNSY